jgi:chromatin structure-remodeling complex protein RSC7
MPRGRGKEGGPRLRLSASIYSSSSVLRLSILTHALGNSTPAVKVDVSDEDMADPIVQDEDDQDDDHVEQDGAEDDDGEQDVEDDQDGRDHSSPPVVQTIPRKRGRGRPPTRPRPDWDTPEPGTGNGSESGTPRRKRGRPSGIGGPRGGFRGRPRGGPSHATRVPIDKEGNMMDVINDEIALPEDPQGETKVNKDGHLQGGRDYRVRVFTILGRGDRLYMLSTEPARCTGFRDSYLFFTKHLQLYKIIIGEEEKKDLISRDIIPHSYKGRAIGVVTARSVFREFGARIVIGGRKIIDDYHVQAAKERGDIEGELADPNDHLPAPGEAYNKNQYVAWHGASQVYHNNAPSVPLQPGKPAPGKRKTNITTGNWQFEHAREARYYLDFVAYLQLLLIESSRFNSSLTAARRSNLNGVYDINTNLMFYPKIMQPTHIKWEPVVSGDENHSTNGESGIFKPLPDLIARNYLVTDTYFESAPRANLGVPGPDGDADDLCTNGLSTIPQDVLDELPEECRAAFEEAKSAELSWKSKWHDEHNDGARGKLRIGFNGFPV